MAVNLASVLTPEKLLFCLDVDAKCCILLLLIIRMKYINKCSENKYKISLHIAYKSRCRIEREDVSYSYSVHKSCIQRRKSEIRVTPNRAGCI